MKLIVSLALALTASTAFAHGNVSCPAVPQEEKQPQKELQKKLEGEGWKVRKVQNSNGCYEVYGVDDKGAKVEAFFNPKTFDRVYPEGERAAGKK
ncbi:PepSY domain-containing protein [Roseateles puraquae]|uniref:PepSY domain-containing protein n=1 Tax=Roseateles puraquae TaxID=431059 RepID=UPI0031DD384D